MDSVAEVKTCEGCPYNDYNDTCLAVSKPISDLCIQVWCKLENKTLEQIFKEFEYVHRLKV